MPKKDIAVYISNQEILLFLIHYAVDLLCNKRPDADETTSKASLHLPRLCYFNPYHGVFLALRQCANRARSARHRAVAECDLDRRLASLPRRQTHSPSSN